ncbi:hypothetical protein [Pseudolabrys sp.]|uniref:hypothetical protein n=1 Tax=Pseudolabrys sp. TaxID=1960880 RepID=UPI003D0AA896
MSKSTRSDQTELIESLQEKLAVQEARIADLEAVLGMHDKSLAATFKLSKSLSDILGLLVSLPAVTPEMINVRLEIATDPKVAIHRLREALKPWGVKIEAKRSLGYFLSPEEKARIKSIVTPAVTPPSAAPSAAPEAGVQPDQDKQEAA